MDDLPAPTKRADQPAKPAIPDEGESRAAVATTVAWMLLALSCASAQIVAFVVWLIARAGGPPANRPNALMLVVSTLVGVSILSGLGILIFTPVVYRVRKSSPPITITIFAVLIALLPLVFLASILLLNPEP